MNLNILDVEHGSCAVGSLPNGHVFLVDAGSSVNGESPSRFLATYGMRQVDHLYITNYDEDHVSDLPRLRHEVTIRGLFRNKSVSPSDLVAIKQQSCPVIGQGIGALLQMMQEYNVPLDATSDAVYPEGLSCKIFSNLYPLFTDTNNLSLAVFLRWGSSCILFPGDLERVGWLELLKDPLFRGWLGLVNIFVASHHGRESGYCREVFDYCRPDIIIASDCGVRYETQLVDYGRHATGVSWNEGSSVRRYLTTRCDGAISVSFSDSSYGIRVSQ